MSPLPPDAETRPLAPAALYAGAVRVLARVPGDAGVRLAERLYGEEVTREALREVKESASKGSGEVGAR